MTSHSRILRIWTCYSFPLVTGLTVLVLALVSVRFLNNQYQYHLTQQVEAQAALLAAQIAATRKYITTHYVDQVQRSQVAPLSRAPLPFMATREIAAEMATQGWYTAELMSLTPLNPANLPHDDFQREALQAIEVGADAYVRVESVGGLQQFRRMTPDKAMTAGCISCHTTKRVGDILGGLSISIPMAKMEAARTTYARQLAITVVTLAVGFLATIYLLYYRNVARVQERSAQLANANHTLQLEISERERTEKRLNGTLQELERLSRDHMLLSQMTEHFQACHRAEEAYTVFETMARKFFPRDVGALCITRISRHLVEPVAVWGNPQCNQSEFPPSECWAMRRGQVHQGGASSIPCGHVRPPIPPAYVCIPMMAQGGALGILHVRWGAYPERAPDVSEGERMTVNERLAITVAEQTALALANLDLREALHAQSIRDSLTGLFNRRYMEASLEQELCRARREGHSIGLIMLDIDHFKRFNDLCGHEAGDTVIREIGCLLQVSVRGEDIACRYGGEEFLVIMPAMSLAMTKQRGEQLREAAKTLKIRDGVRTMEPVTLSLGIAMCPDHGTTPDTLLRAADQALYQAKRDGRDRVIVAT